MSTNASTSSVAPVMAATAPVDRPLIAPAKADDGDDSEWEYEYSTTETEVGCHHERTEGGCDY